LLEYQTKKRDNKNFYFIATTNAISFERNIICIIDLENYDATMTIYRDLDDYFTVN